mgnify:CR=1 FL=1
MKRILLVEDDQLLGAGLQDYFQENGFLCQWVSEAVEVEAYLHKVDLMVLDRQLAAGDSLRWLPLWLMKSALPVIILTAKNTVEQRVEGLSAGAKDYLVKPFAYAELLARVAAQLRPLGEAKVFFQALTIDLARHQVWLENSLVELKPKEFQLLILLVQNANRVYHRDELLNKVWGFQTFPSTRTVDNHILNLRQKLPCLTIETLRGVGYRLKEF